MNQLTDTNNTCLLKANNLSKIFNSSIKALDHLSLSLSRSESLGLLGPNGAGKTTAMHVFLGLLTPTEGDVSVLGLSPLHHRHAISKKVNFSSAYVELPSNLKVSECLKVFSHLYNVVKPKQEIESLLELFEMTHFFNRIIGSLSSGEKTRLNLCKCFLNNPVLLLLDEPTASLDPEKADHVRKILKRIQSERKMGILYTSHNMSEVEEMCDRILFINHGRIIAEGTHASLLSEYGAKSMEEVFIKIVRKC